jgi:hypothetical protein
MSTRRPLKTRRGRKKRLRNKGIANNGGYTNIERTAITFLDPRKFITLKYVENYQITLLTTVGDQQRMRLNSVFDPNDTGGGHQPYGFDQLAALYNRYRVWKAKWRVTFSPSSASYPALVIPTNGAITAITTAATWQAAAEKPYAKSWIQGASGKSQRLSGSIYINKLTGISSQEYRADDRTGALTSADPGEIVYLYLGIVNPNANTIIVNFIIEMEFDTEFYDPIMLTQSSLSVPQPPYKVIRKNTDGTLVVKST